MKKEGKTIMKVILPLLLLVLMVTGMSVIGCAGEPEGDVTETEKEKNCNYRAELGQSCISGVYPGFYHRTWLWLPDRDSFWHQYCHV